MPKTSLEASQVSWDGANRVIIRSGDLANSLIEDGKEAVASGFLDNAAGLKAGDISIDAFGAVVIRSKALQDQLNNVFWGPGGLSENGNDVCANPACGANAYKCGGGHVVEEAVV